MTKYHRFLTWSLTAIALALAGGAAHADSLVVVETRGGLHLAVGTSIDGDKPLALDDGQSITLLASNGQILRLDGPYSDTPGRNVRGTGGDVRSAIAALATAQQARTADIGVVRGENEVTLPDPWVVDVSHPGTSCVDASRSVVLWRAAPLDAVQVIFSPKDLSWQESGVWPAAADRLSLPANMPLRDHTDYVVDLGGRLAPVKIRLVPDTVDNDAMRIGYMNEMGCGNQVKALFALYRK